MEETAVEDAEKANQVPYRRFLFKLGLQVGEWDIDYLESVMPLSLLYEWMAFNRLRAVRLRSRAPTLAHLRVPRLLRNGMLIANLVNLWTGRHARKFKADDFIPASVKPQASPVTKPTKSASQVYQLFKTGLGLMGIKPKKVVDADD